MNPLITALTKIKALAENPHWSAARRWAIVEEAQKALDAAAPERERVTLPAPETTTTGRHIVTVVLTARCTGYEAGLIRDAAQNAGWAKADELKAPLGSFSRIEVVR